MKSLIIHLSSATRRTANVARLLRDLPSAQVVDAVAGLDANAVEDVSLASGSFHHPPYPFQLNPGEVGCFLSHRRCWEMIAEDDAPYGLIVEDDMTIDTTLFAAAMQLVHAFADEHSYIRLPAKTRERPAREIARQGSTALFLPQTIGLQSVCQIVGRSAARRLLEVSTVIDRPVDTTLQMHWATGQPIHTILPSGISEMSGQSTIQRKTRTSDVLMREVRRARYRAQIRRMPQNG